jgi:hypothetical protein
VAAPKLRLEVIGASSSSSSGSSYDTTAAASAEEAAVSWAETAAEREDTGASSSSLLLLLLLLIALAFDFRAAACEQSRRAIDAIARDALTDTAADAIAAARWGGFCFVLAAAAAAAELRVFCIWASCSRSLKDCISLWRSVWISCSWMLLTPIPWSCV